MALSGCTGQFKIQENVLQLASGSPEVGCWSNPVEFSSCTNKADWITKASKKEEECGGGLQSHNIFTCTCSKITLEWALRVTRNPKTTTWPHWLTLPLEQTVWCRSRPVHKSHLYNLKRGWNGLPIPSKATVETLYSIYLSLSLKDVWCSCLWSNVAQWKRPVRALKNHLQYYFQLAAFWNKSWSNLKMWRKKNSHIPTPQSVRKSWHAATGISGSWGVL